MNRQFELKQSTTIISRGLTLQTIGIMRNVGYVAGEPTKYPVFNPTNNFIFESPEDDASSNQNWRKCYDPTVGKNNILASNPNWPYPSLIFHITDKLGFNPPKYQFHSIRNVHGVASDKPLTYRLAIL